jgi:hypothetical protein
MEMSFIFFEIRSEFLKYCVVEVGLQRFKVNVAFIFWIQCKKKLK